MTDRMISYWHCQPFGSQWNAIVVGVNVATACAWTASCLLYLVVVAHVIPKFSRTSAVPSGKEPLNLLIPSFSRCHPCYRCKSQQTRGRVYVSPVIFRLCNRELQNSLQFFSSSPVSRFSAEFDLTFGVIFSIRGVHSRRLSSVEYNLTNRNNAQRRRRC